jgi:Predicted membrane protein
MQLATGGRLNAASFWLGAGAPPPLPDAAIVIGGHTPQLDLRALVALLRLLPQGGGDAPPLTTSTLHADALVYGSTHSGPTTLTLTPQATGLQLDLEGSGAAGRLHYDRADNAVRGQIRHLVLAPFPAEQPPAKAAKPAEDEAALQPAKLPTVDLRLADLQVGKTKLGQWLLRTSRADGGQRIDLLRASGGAITGSATGHWRRRGGHSTAALKFNFDVSRIGAVLKTFGFADNVTAKKAHFSGDLAWPRTSRGLTLAGAAGKLGLRLEDGTLKTVHPGAGRVLGLLNLYALPRRLTLNFHDVVDKGLGYDHIQGDFNLSEGQARTHNLRIKAPSLRMDIDGRIGLAAQDFDEIITVHPDYSTGVTLGAALLGGPIAGGIALLAQQLVGKALDSLTSLSYRLSGSWDNPQVKRIGTTAAKAAKKSALASPASAPAAPGSVPSVVSPKRSPPP